MSSNIEFYFGNIRQCDFYKASEQMLQYIFDNHSNKQFSHLKCEQNFIVYYVNSDKIRYRIIKRDQSSIKFSIMNTSEGPFKFNEETRFYVNKNRDYLMNAWEDWTTVLNVLDHLQLTNLLEDFLIKNEFIPNSSILISRLN